MEKANSDLCGALSNLNATWNRVGLQDTSGSEVDTKEELLDAILLVRGIEFLKEGHR